MCIYPSLRHWHSDLHALLGLLLLLRLLRMWLRLLWLQVAALLVGQAGWHGQQDLWRAICRPIHGVHVSLHPPAVASLWQQLARGLLPA